MQKRTNRNEALVCDACGEEGGQVRHVSRSYGKGGRLLVIENVPVISCPHCGESYMTATTLHEIERIKCQRLSVATIRPVAVAVLRRQTKHGDTCLAPSGFSYLLQVPYSLDHLTLS